MLVLIAVIAQSNVIKTVLTHLALWPTFLHNLPVEGHPAPWSLQRVVAAEFIHTPHTCSAAWSDVPPGAAGSPRRPSEAELGGPSFRPSSA
jgi:hypothetical protein